MTDVSQSAQDWASGYTKPGFTPITDLPGRLSSFSYIGGVIELTKPVEAIEMGSSGDVGDGAWTPLEGVTTTPDTKLPELKWLKFPIPATPTLIRVERRPGDQHPFTVYTLMMPGSTRPFPKIPVCRLHVAAMGHVPKSALVSMLGGGQGYDDVILGVKLGVHLVGEYSADPGAALKIIEQSEGGDALKAALPEQLQVIAEVGQVRRNKIQHTAQTFLQKRKTS